MKPIKIFLLFFIFTVIVNNIIGAHIAIAAMNSSSFIIPTDTFSDIGDADGRQTSTSFISTDTIGDLAIGDVTSASFTLGSGFQALTSEPIFTFSLSGGSSITLDPAPNVNEISTASTTATTSTNAILGYTTTIAEDGNLRTGSASITDVANGAVGPAGVEEYGVAISGADRAFSDDQAITTTPTIIATRSSLGANIATTVTYKLSISSTTPNGTYSHIVTFVSTPNF